MDPGEQGVLTPIFQLNQKIFSSKDSAECLRTRNELNEMVRKAKLEYPCKLRNELKDDINNPKKVAENSFNTNEREKFANLTLYET